MMTIMIAVDIMSMIMGFTMRPEINSNDFGCFWN